MKKYIVVSAHYDYDLENKVNSYINGGYYPIGGVSVFHKTTEYYYHQAMIYVGEEK